MAKPIHSDPPPMAGSLADLASGLLSLLCLESFALAQRTGVKTVHFLTREGIFFQNFFDTFARSADWNVRSGLFHASRLSTFAASLTSDGPAGLGRLLSQYRTAGWEQILSSLNAWPPPPHIARLLAQRANAHLEGEVLLQVAVSDPEISAWLKAVAGERHRELCTYVAQHHPELSRSRDTVLVDIGWRGTIQDNLALAMPSVHWHGVYLGLLAYLNQQPSNCEKHGLLFEGGRNEQGPVAGNVMIIEYLFHAPIGSVIGYCDGEPVHAASEPENRDGFAGHFQSALLAQAACCGQMLAGATDPAERGILLARWRHDAATFLLRCQSVGPELFDAIRRFRHDEAFGLGKTVQIDEALSLKSAFRATFSRQARDLFIQHSLAIPADLRRSVQLGWWVRLWLLLHGIVGRLKHLAHQKE
jgi:hypothetical protein